MTGYLVWISSVVEYLAGHMVWGPGRARLVKFVLNSDIFGDLYGKSEDSH